jgi:hypothetical protein
VGPVAELGHVVVEGYDGAGEIERRVQSVGEVIPKGVVRGFGGDGDAVALGEIRGIELFVVGVISVKGVIGCQREGERTSRELLLWDAVLQ